MISGIAKVIIALNGNIKKTQIAAGFSWGVLLALLPAGNAFWIVLFTLSLFFKHHQGGKLLVMALLKLAMPLVHPLTDELGWALLHLDALVPVWTALYNMPFVPFTRFNNTLVAGGLALGIALWLPVFFLITALVPVYRTTWLPCLLDTAVFKAVRGFPLVTKISGAVKTMSAFSKEEA